MASKKAGNEKALKIKGIYSEQFKGVSEKSSGKG